MLRVPAGLSPMLATAGPLPPDDGRWAYEVKWDGYRALVAVDGDALALQSRRGLDSTREFPGLPPLRCPVPAVLDAEVVALDDQGRPDFGLLQNRLRQTGTRPVPMALVVFDVLQVDGTDVTAASYDDRRALLEQLGVEGAQVPAAFLSGGAELLASTRAQGLEGVVAKRRDSPYEPGRRTDRWVKAKNVLRQSVVVIGWRLGDKGRAGRLGSLLVAVAGPDGLVYAGRVGSGIAGAELARLEGLLAPLAADDAPCEVPREDARTAHWVRPELVAEVELTAWTADGRLRHPAYKGLRSDLDPGEVVRE